MASLKIPKDDHFDDPIKRLEEAVAAGDAHAFEAIFQNVDWKSRSPEDFLRAAQLALEISDYAGEEDLSIVALEGKFADDPSWDDLPEFLEKYWREIEETVETD
ncbi:MAG: hypothetical protein L0229_14195 [Blastocatellia bacterium]|nr:hypothetical protein [Blastocatellia bacterium]